jgi:putative transposase
VTMKFSGICFELDIIFGDARWHVVYFLSYRQIEEMMGERGVEVDHFTLNCGSSNVCLALQLHFLLATRPEL